MSPGTEFDKTTMPLTQTSQSDYENFCRLDVLGLADRPENDQEMVYDEFKEQLERYPARGTQPNLPWKTNHPSLSTNERGNHRILEQ